MLEKDLLSMVFFAALPASYISIWVVPQFFTAYVFLISSVGSDTGFSRFILPAVPPVFVLFVILLRRVRLNGVDVAADPKWPGHFLH